MSSNNITNSSSTSSISTMDIKILIHHTLVKDTNITRYSNKKKTSVRKIAARLYGMYLLFNPSLCESRPSVISEEDWRSLQIAELDHKLVLPYSVSPNKTTITLSIHPLYDKYVHALVNYGPSPDRITNHRKTIFRWWSDTGDNLFSFGSLADKGRIIRSIQFKNSYFHTVIQSELKLSNLMVEMATYIDQIYKLYIDDPNYQIQYGRCRKPIQVIVPIEEAIRSSLST